MVYFDNGATTPVCSEAAAACLRSFENFGNPSSLHGIGLTAKNAVRADANKIERILNAGEGTLYFTSGATEANNWAICCTALQVKKGKHIITSKTEHPSVLEPFRDLEKRGFRVTYVGLDERGNLDLDQLFEAVSDDTVLVSIMAVNNEIGAINDVSAIGNKIKQINENILFHVDGVCAFCKLPVNVNKSKIDLFSLSGHKLYAPKGIGGLYIREGTRINPFVVGGGQQKNRRSGTENTPFIAALAAAAEMCERDMSKNAEKVLLLKDKLIEGILELDAEIIGPYEHGKSSPYVLNAGFRWIKSQIMVNALEQRGIYVAAGSACSSNKPGGKMLSETLSAMEIDTAIAGGAVRFSFSIYNTIEEIDVCINALRDICSKYRGKV